MDAKTIRENMRSKMEDPTPCVYFVDEEERKSQRVPYACAYFKVIKHTARDGCPIGAGKECRHYISENEDLNAKQRQEVEGVFAKLWNVKGGSHDTKVKHADCS